MRVVSFLASLGAVLGYQTITADSPFLQWQGRTFDNDGLRSFSWPGVRFQFVVEGTTWASMTLLSNNTVTRMKVFIDGIDAATLWINDSHFGGNYMLAIGLDPSIQHTVTVYNIIEPQYQQSNNFFQKPTLQSVSVDGSFVAPPPPLSRKLEFIGDSLTVGYGANSPQFVPFSSCPGTIATEDNSATWANLLCGNFSANCSIVAWSGIGVYESSRGNFTDQMPTVYTRALGTISEVPWDFTNFTPDAVVINLGTNDFGHDHDNGTAWEDAFVATYTQFVLNITTAYYKSPKLQVFVAIGPGARSPNVIDCLNRVIANVNAAGGSAVFLDVQTELIEGCAGHPSREGHYNMFLQAAPQIAKVMGWGK